MKAIQLEQPHRFRPITVDEPPAPATDEALVQVRRIGICGTDYSGYLGKMPFFSYPRIPGHELGVEVIAVGPNVTHIRPGDRCAVEPYINCQRCFACRRGNGNCCENLKVLGVMMDGGMRERVVIPAVKLHPANHLSLEQCALVETLAIGCHAVDRGQPKAGEHVLIIGAGPIGLAVLEFVKLSGAHPIVMDLNEQRLAFVRERMHVADAIAFHDEPAALAHLADLTDGTLAQVVIDATGNHLSMGRALQYASFTGRIVFVGITTQEISFAHPLMHRREMTLLASRNAHPADFIRIIELIERRQIDTVPWITHRAGFEEMIDLFPQWLRPESGVIKAIVELD
jgi:2-desacetyl-2-hydroxyethyl bacteriochlorophyllide A dehydrogenase